MWIYCKGQKLCVVSARMGTWSLVWYVVCVFLSIYRLELAVKYIRLLFDVALQEAVFVDQWRYTGWLLSLALYVVPEAIGTLLQVVTDHIM